MKVTVRITQNFTSEAKPLLKKYPSLSGDLQKLQKELLATPKLGTDLGQNCYKIRLKITSKGKGKSGGARVITLVDTTIIGITEQTTNGETTVYLLSIYDKGEVSSISDKELKDLVRGLRKL